MLHLQSQWLGEEALFVCQRQTHSCLIQRLAYSSHYFDWDIQAYNGYNYFVTFRSTIIPHTRVFIVRGLRSCLVRHDTGEMRWVSVWQAVTEVTNVGSGWSRIGFWGRCATGSNRKLERNAHCKVEWCVRLYDCTPVRLYGCTSVRLYVCASVRLHGFMAVRLYVCAAVRLYGCTNVRLCGCTTVRLFSCKAYGCTAVIH